MYPSRDIDMKSTDTDTSGLLRGRVRDDPQPG
jgi:hypothetical protein